MASDRFVIVGASLAGMKAAETLRSEGFDGGIVLVGDEYHLPYERPPLSKGFLLGRDEESVAFPHDRRWYAEQDVELRLGTEAVALDPALRRVALADGSSLDYTKLLLTTGSRLRRLDVPGADVAGVFYLRTIDDSERLLDRLRRGGRVVVVGAGWVGLETAAAAREHGCEVSVVEPQPSPLYGVLGPEVGGFFADAHAARGVVFRFGEGVSEFRGSGGRVTEVVTTAGEALPADAVVVGVGILPNVELAQAAGIEVDDGVVCDASLRTSDPDVFAAGDVASWENPALGYRVRVEHWANAHDGGQAAARSMLGQEVSYDVLPFFYSDQYDLGMEYAGHVRRGTATDLVLRGDRDAGEFLAFWTAEGRVLAGMHVNVWDTIEAIQELIRSRAVVEPARLADSTVPLDQVVTGSTRT